MRANNRANAANNEAFKARVHDQILAQSQRSTMGYEEYRRKAFTNAFGLGGEIDVLSCEVNLKCPYSQQRVKVPVRANTCRHASCIDINSWQDIFAHQKQMRDPTAPCPICGVRVALSSLQIDRWMERVLEHTPVDVLLVIFERDSQLDPSRAEQRQKREREEFVIEATQQYETVRVKEEPGVGSSPRYPRPSLGDEVIPPSAEEEPQVSFPGATNDGIAAALFDQIPGAGAMLADISQEEPLVVPSTAAIETTEEHTTAVASAPTATASAPLPPAVPPQRTSEDEISPAAATDASQKRDATPIPLATQQPTFSTMDLLQYQTTWEPVCTSCGAFAPATAGIPVTCPSCGTVVQRGDVQTLVRPFPGGLMRMEYHRGGDIILTGPRSDALASYLWRVGFFRTPMGYLWHTGNPAIGKGEVDFLERLAQTAVDGNDLSEVKPVPQMFWLRWSNPAAPRTFPGTEVANAAGGAATTAAGNGPTQWWAGAAAQAQQGSTQW